MPQKKSISRVEKGPPVRTSRRLMSLALRQTQTPSEAVPRYPRVSKIFFDRLFRKLFVGVLVYITGTPHLEVRSFAFRSTRSLLGLTLSFQMSRIRLRE